MERIKVYNEKGMPVKKGVGIFARMFMDDFLLLLVEDEARSTIRIFGEFHRTVLYLETMAGGFTKRRVEESS